MIPGFSNAIVPAGHEKESQAKVGHRMFRLPPPLPRCNGGCWPTGRRALHCDGSIYEIPNLASNCGHVLPIRAVASRLPACLPAGAVQAKLQDIRCGTPAAFPHLVTRPPHVFVLILGGVKLY